MTCACTQAASAKMQVSPAARCLECGDESEQMRLILSKGMSMNPDQPDLSWRGSRNSAT